MNINTFSKVTGVSSHTLRYYEKIGLLKGVLRNSSGHRVFSSKDQRWIEFIIRLKETNMPLKEILEYGVLREKGEKTILARQEILENHRHALLIQMESQKTHLLALDKKIEFYHNQTKKNK